MSEFALYAEEFNQTQKEYQVIAEYKEDPSRALLEGGESPDLVVGKYLSSTEVKARFSSLDFIFSRSGNQKEAFYPGSLKAGQLGDSQRLLPVSYDLPVLLSLEKEGEPMFLDWETMLKKSQAYSDLTIGKRHLGFSPRWNGSWIPALGNLFGVDFREEAKVLEWNQDRLTDFLASLRDWIDKSNGGLENDGDFQRRYLAGSAQSLLRDRRVLYYPTTLKDFFSWPEDERTGLQFQYPSKEQIVPVLEDVVYLGIPLAAPDRTAAEAFGAWFFRTATQKRLLDRQLEERITALGIGGGLSPLLDINDRDYPDHEQAFLGRIPAAAALRFPAALPANWESLKENVLTPWFASSLAGKKPAPLRETVNRWAGSR